MDLFKEIFETATRPFFKMYTLDAIHLDKPLLTPDGYYRRITEGMAVCIKDGQLVDGEVGTHIVTHVRGNLSNTKFAIVVNSMQTLELNILDL